MSKVRKLERLSEFVDQIETSGNLTENEAFLVKYVRYLQGTIESQWLLEDLMVTVNKDNKGIAE